MKLTVSLKLIAMLTITAALQATVFAAEERAADHDALRALRAKAVVAINSQDSRALASCCAREFVFTAIDQTVVTNEAQFAALFDRMFRGKAAIVTSLKADPEAAILTRFIDQNTGICYGSTKDTYTMKDGRVVVMNARWTATVVKENGEWKVAAAHVGVDFLNNPVLTRVAAFAKKLAVVTAVIGLVVGLILGRVLAARKSQ